MATLTEVERRVKTDLRLPAGLEIHVTNASGPVNGKTIVKTVNLDKFIADAQTKGGSMRLAMFCTRYARCIGAQVGATVTLRFLGMMPDGRQSIAKFMPA